MEFEDRGDDSARDENLLDDALVDAADDAVDPAEEEKMANEETTWEKVMEIGKRETRVKQEVCNSLDKDELETVLGTMDFFGADKRDLQQTFFDLNIAKYRVFDWLAMALHGRIDNPQSLQVLAWAYIKADGDIDKFIDDLRVNDYDIDHSWTAIELEKGWA
jgi:hypothetical protein